VERDTRTTPPAVGDEQETLSSFLDWHRATFELKCTGIPPERLSGQDFDDLDGDIEEAFDVWRAECRRSREIVAAASLEETGTRLRTGEPFSLRWLMVHLIAEYARHNGHADLLRERIDGATGM
jgi:hypothetical protein